jgi:hypothetical protein
VGIPEDKFAPRCQSGRRIGSRLEPEEVKSGLGELHSVYSKSCRSCRSPATVNCKICRQGQISTYDIAGCLVQLVAQIHNWQGSACNSSHQSQCSKYSSRHCEHSGSTEYVIEIITLASEPLLSTSPRLRLPLKQCDSRGTPALRLCNPAVSQVPGLSTKQPAANYRN